MRRFANGLILAAMVCFVATARAESAPTPTETNPLVKMGATSAPAETGSPVVVPTVPDSTVVVPPAPTTSKPGEEEKTPKASADRITKCLTWLKMARKEASGMADSEESLQQKDYLLGVLMMEFAKCGDIPSAKKVFDEISAGQRLMWLGPLVSGMLVHSTNHDEALKMLKAVEDENARKLALRGLAAEMVDMEALEGLKLIHKLPPADQPQVLGDWVMGLVLAGKLVNARIAAEGAPTTDMRKAVAVLDLAGRVAHGEKTVAEAQAASGKSIQEFLPYVMAIDWARVKDLDPNVARGVLRHVPPSLARGAMEIGMAKNFIKQRRFKLAENFAGVMVRDLRAVPANRIPGPVYVEIAAVLAGVGQFDSAKRMFYRGLANRENPLTIDSILTFFDALLAADGGDMADRLGAQMPPIFQNQVVRLWAKHYIRRDQLGEIRKLLAKQKTPESRAWLYVGVATALREIVEKP